MSERVELVCSNCGEPGRLSVEVQVDGWEAIDVFRGENGEPVEEKTGDRDVEWDGAIEVGYSCSECDHRSGRLEDAVADPEYDCPQCHATGCPRCGYTGRETEPPPPHPGQLRIDAQMKEAA